MSDTTVSENVGRSSLRTRFQREKRHLPKKSKSKNGARVDKLTVAFIALYELAPEFVAGPLLLEVDSNSETDKALFDYYLNAAAFALEHGLRTIYEPGAQPNWDDQHNLDFGPPTATACIDQSGED